MKNSKGKRFLKEIVFTALAGLWFVAIVAIFLSGFFCKKAADNNNNAQLATETETASASETQASSDTQVSSATEETLEKTKIMTSIAVEYSNKEVSFFSPISCYIKFIISVSDNDSTSYNQYGPIELAAGEKSIFSLDNLSILKYSDTAKITDVMVTDTFVYGNSEFDSSLYSISGSNIEFKCYKREIELSSNKDCFASFLIQTRDGDSSGFLKVNLLKLDANVPRTVTLDDLAPGFFSETTEICSYSPLTIRGYEKKK